jgi:hypothetical protein
MKKTILFTVLSLTVLIKIYAQQDLVIPAVSKNALNFIVASDLGRNGYYEQKPIAELMGIFAESIDIEFVAAAGDVHHFNGVASVHDPLWMTNYELIYAHPELMIDWYVICGNHEYRGNTQAILDYSKVSRRWIAPSKYYTNVHDVGDSAALRLIFIDTAPLIDKYRREVDQYPDAILQNMDHQLAWLDSVLLHSNEKWKIVIGHHPIFAQTKKDETERTDLQNRLAPILEKYGVDLYFSGHIHNFQHLKPPSSSVEYVVNSSASLSRDVKKINETIFCSEKAGFTLCSVDDKTLSFLFIDQKGNVIYTYSIEK